MLKGHVSRNPINPISYEGLSPHISSVTIITFRNRSNILNLTVLSKTNPLTSIIKVVCKYLRQFLGISFDFATLATCYNTE